MDLLISLFYLSGYAQIANISTTTEEIINDTERSTYIRDYLTYLSFAIRLLHASIIFSCKLLSSQVIRKRFYFCAGKEQM
jgi:hypothetical protein